MFTNDTALLQFTVFGHAEQDPDRAMLRAARDKIEACKNPNIRILRQLPNAERPTRLLVQTDAQTVHALLKEFEPAVEIEENRPLFLL